jgi:hypothetical protein
MSQAFTVAVDLVAITVLTIGVYFPRYRRPDMVVAYLGLNVGVLAVAVALSQTTTLGTGFGLGLFGALSIIRLRSTELAQQEVAYYFAALALGLMGGLAVDPPWLPVVLAAAILVAMFLGDHPGLFRRHHQQIINLDRSFVDRDELIDHLEELLGGKVRRVEIRRIDLVNDTTLVDVRFTTPAVRARRPDDARSAPTAAIGT